MTLSVALKIMSFEQIIVNDLLTPRIVVPIIGDGAHLIRSISYYLLNDLGKCQEIQNINSLLQKI